MNKIGIIGIGKIGIRLTEAFLGSTDIQEIWLDTRNKNLLSGFILSCQVTAATIQSNTVIKSFDFDSCNQLDLIVICAKEKYDPRDLMRVTTPHDEWLPKNLRYVGLPSDYPLLKDICHKIPEYRGLVAVITNPVEINTFLLAKWLPQARVIGLGASVDSSRFLYSLAKSSNPEELISLYSSQTKMLEKCILAGEHGSQLMSISNIWNLNKDLKNISKIEISKHIDEAVKIGFEIVTLMGYTLQDCIPRFAEDIRWLLQKEEQENFRSFAVSKENTSLTKPIKLNSDNQIVEFDHYTSQELTQLNIIENRLGSLIKMVEEHLGNC